MEQKQISFLIDTNSFITPYQLYYPFDLAPNFWRCMEEEILNGNIVILDKVYDELIKGDDELSAWVSSIEGLELAKHKDAKIIGKYSEVLAHVQSSGFYTPKALAEWSDARVADPWLIACASVFNYKIVTFEGLNKNLNKASPSSHPKIPDVCREFGVECKNLMDMMRDLSISLK